MKRGRYRHVSRLGRPGRPAHLPAPVGLESECRDKLNGSRASSVLKGRLFKEDFTCFVKRLVLSLWPWR